MVNTLVGGQPGCTYCGVRLPEGTRLERLCDDCKAAANRGYQSHGWSHVIERRMEKMTPQQKQLFRETYDDIYNNDSETATLW